MSRWDPPFAFSRFFFCFTACTYLLHSVSQDLYSSWCRLCPVSVMSSAVYQFFKVKRITLDLLVETLWLPCADSALGFLVIIREICKQGPEMELTTVGITAMCDGGVASESFGSAVSLPFALHLAPRLPVPPQAGFLSFSPLNASPGGLWCCSLHTWTLCSATAKDRKSVV